ncbi:MAG TPA: hypothetical protein VGO34_08940 [Alphaproteobacteria bacterium]
MSKHRTLLHGLAGALVAVAVLAGPSAVMAQSSLEQRQQQLNRDLDVKRQQRSQDAVGQQQDNQAEQRLQQQQRQIEQRNQMRSDRDARRARDLNDPANKKP